MVNDGGRRLSPLGKSGYERLAERLVGLHCDAFAMLLTHRLIAFMVKCITGSRAIEPADKWELIRVNYDPPQAQL